MWSFSVKLMGLGLGGSGQIQGVCDKWRRVLHGERDPNWAPHSQMSTLLWRLKAEAPPSCCCCGVQGQLG